MLIQIIRWCLALVKPKRASTSRLAKLFTLRVDQKRNCQSVSLLLPTCSPSDVVCATDDISPLIATTDLTQAVVLLIKSVEVVSLKHLIAELSERDSFRR